MKEDETYERIQRAPPLVDLVSELKSTFNADSNIAGLGLDRCLTHSFAGTHGASGCAPSGADRACRTDGPDMGRERARVNSGTSLKISRASTL